MKGSPLKADSYWYTDSSNSNNGGGARIYEQKPKTDIRVSFSGDRIVCQIEVAI